MITEHDLTSSLNRIAAEDAQPHEFRQRLDRAISRPRPSALRRFGPALAAAACVVVIAAVALVLGVAPSHRHPATHPATHPVHRAGRYVVASFHGTGNGTREVPAATAPADRLSAIVVTCDGPGGLQVNTYDVTTCHGDGSVALGTGTRATPRRLRIVTAPTVAWHISVRFDIDYRTNGLVEHPADPLLTRTDTLAHGTGTGTGTVHIGPVTTRTSNIRVLLACTGSGVRLSSRDQRFDGQYTHTCEPDTSYAFDLSRVVLPDDFTVTASATTTWRLVVLGQ
jgi:hypothetical protein